ncbi:hypothetical protein [Pantoea sp.]|uniref:hypothetical protein n=1 Tax=Pantoea sp. TaxID=69393 RepID=UPI0031D23B28
MLLDMSGLPEWGEIFFHPYRIITDDGLMLLDDLLEDVAVSGVVTHEITTFEEQDKLPI